MVDFVTWSQYLAAVSCDTHGPSHPILCLTNRDNRGNQFEVLTRAQFEAETKKQRWYQSTCHRLTLAEMVAITKNSLQTWRITPAVGKYPAMKYRQNITRSLGLDLENAIQIGDTINVEYIEGVTKQLEDAAVKTTHVTCALTALQAMQKRTKAKRLQEKVASLWGLIKYYLWYWICNQEKSIQMLQRNMVNVQAIKDRACMALRERIYFNMTFFHEEVKVGEEPKFDDYKVPRDVKKKWIVHYAADKFDVKSAVTKQWGDDPRHLRAAEEMRQRIILLTQFWDNLLRLDQPPEPLTTTSETAPFLLQ